jgi:hypothetical protein
MIDTADPPPEQWARRAHGHAGSAVLFSLSLVELATPANNATLPANQTMQGRTTWPV